MIRHVERATTIAARPEVLFDRLDDFERLGGHMSGSSAMMGGGGMTYQFDEAGGRAVGSSVRMAGSAFGLRLALEEVVTERIPPRRKVWRTVGEPRLVVIGPYEMGFQIDPRGEASRLRMWIDYELPPRLGGWAAPLAGFYARWCVERMSAAGAEDHRPERALP